MMAAVPLVVPWFEASRHLLPYTVSCRLAVCVHRWLVPPWQSQSCACVPLVVAEPGMSTHRPDAPPTMVALCGVPVLCGPAAAMTACAADGQLPLVTVTLPE